LRDFGEIENLQVSSKGPGDFVSNADKKAERVIITELLASRPDYGILAEESGVEHGKKDAEYRFVIDPLDGTNNFLHGFPYWAVSIGLEKNGELEAGVIIVPVLDEIYFAEKGKGAFLNDKRIRVSSRKHLSEAFVGCGSASSFRRPTNLPFNIQHVLNKLGSSVASVRCMNAAAVDLVFTAAGRYDAMVDTGLKKWDMAAGIVILKEAGGQITEILGRDDYYETGNILASNYHLHDKLIGLLSPPKE